MSTAPGFAATPLISRGRLTAANTNRDGTGTLVDITAAAPAGGLKVERIIMQANGTTTAGMIRLYTNDGTNARLVAEVAVQAITPSATQKVWSAEIDCSKLESILLLQSGWKLQAAPHNAEGFEVTVIAGGF